MFSENIAAVDSVNNYPSPIAFNQLHIEDLSAFTRAYEKQNWLGGTHYLSLLKEFAVDEGEYRLVSGFQVSLVYLNSQSHWKFDSEHIDRVNVWPVPNVTSKIRDSEKQIIDPTE